MAAEVLSNVSGALATTMAPQLTRVWNRIAVLAQNVPIIESGGQGAGQNVAWDVESSGATAASFVEGSDIAGGEFNFDPVTKASLSWGQYRSPFQLSNLEINAAAANVANAVALEDMFAERVIGALSKIVAQINTDMFAGTGTDGSGNPNIVGLASALAASGSYATINKGSITEWAGNVNANGGTLRALQMLLLAQLEQSVYTASGMEPSLLVSTPGIHTKYESLFEATRRTVDSGQGPIPSYQGSTGRLFWRGKPVLRDRNCTSNTLFMLNPDELEFRVLPWAKAADGVQVERKAGVSSNGKDSQDTGIPIRVYPLGRTGSGVKFVAEVYCQLKVKRPGAHGMLQDISET